MRTLRFLLRKEFLQIFRDRLMVAQMLLMPMIQLLLLASAATFEVKRASMYVVDLDHSTAARAIVSRLQASRRFVVVGASPSGALASEAMLSHRAGIILGIPAGFGRDLVRARVATVQLVLSAEDGAAAGVTQSYAAQVIASYARDVGAAVVAAPRGPAIDVRDRKSVV